MMWQIYLLRIIIKICHISQCERAAPEKRRRTFGVVVLPGGRRVVCLWITFPAAVRKKCAITHRPQTRMNAGFPDNVPKLCTMRTIYDGRYVK